MSKVDVELDERGYRILIESDSLARAGELFDREGIRLPLYLVSNPIVFALYGARLQSALGDRLAGQPILIPDGEQHKTTASCEIIHTALIEQQADRSSCLVSLGGGVTGDIAGFAAATFLRGIPYIQVPTTLLAQVDSSVGGKTGVNHRLGKNLIGAFHQPRCVLIDPATLSTLPQREFSSGLYEVVKYGLISDAGFFAVFESRLDELLNRAEEALLEAIRRCCQLKAEVCSKDEREGGLRRILNLGHTFGHALEAATSYRRLTHGEAVGYGIKAAAFLSQLMGLISVSDCGRIAACIDRIGRPPSAADISFQQLRESMTRDKKRSQGRLKFVVLQEIGEAKVVDEPPSAMLEESWLRAVGKGS